MSSSEFYREYSTQWTDVLVKARESYHSPVADFHKHDYYEINLILSGNVNILLENQVNDGIGSRIILTPPNTPHFVTCKPDTLYSRLYLLFTESFLENYIPQWQSIKDLFGVGGRVVELTLEQKNFCKRHIERIAEETSPLRQRLLILYMLSSIGEFSQNISGQRNTPSYILDALAYIEKHYAEKITAASLAQRLYVGRTTLMTAFKRYTGSTLNEYIMQCRIKKAIEQLAHGHTEQETAESCGFGDISNLIRAFKRIFGVTPRQYMLQAKNNKA